MGNELKLNLTVDETNVILGALGAQPFTKVNTLIGKIQTQANDQFKEVENKKENQKTKVKK